MSTFSTPPDLTANQFESISRMVYQQCGILLGEGKEGLVRSRLTKRLRLLGMSSFDQYLQFVQKPSAVEEFSAMIDSLTTNKTSFFREPQHFHYLRAHILPRLCSSRQKLRFWSAGCSSGEEPYSLAIMLREEIPNIDQWDCRILATDISNKILKKARDGVYEVEALSDVPSQQRQKHFKQTGSGRELLYQVNDNLRKMVCFARLNLMENWLMKGPFDVIFCRNVMIYFDKTTQSALARRFWKMIPVGGFLFVGHSESLTSAAHNFRYVQPAIYEK